MEDLEKHLIAENHKRTIQDEINNLIEDFKIDSLEKTLERLIYIFNVEAVDTAQSELLQAKVASLFVNLMGIWQKNGRKISDLKRKIENFFGSMSELPEFFKCVRATKLGKRQPCLLESIKETLKRFEVMENLEKVFEKTCKGMIVGGSMAYREILAEHSIISLCQNR